MSAATVIYCHGRLVPVQIRDGQQVCTGCGRPLDGWLIDTAGCPVRAKATA